MTVTPDHIRRLAASVVGPREEDVFAYVQATDAAQREEVRALLQRMAHDGEIRRPDGRIYLTRQT